MIVVTGGAGFIGSAIVAALNARGIKEIIIVDALDESEKWKNLVNLKFAEYEDREGFIKGIGYDEKEYRDSIEGIIHMGACSSTTEKNSAFLMENNYKYSQYLGEWCARNNKKFVYASSAATYGDGKLGFLDDYIIAEQLKPLNMYGYSKHLFDLWAIRTGVIQKAAGLKFFNVYGPNEYHKGDMRSVVHKAFGQIKSEGKLKLFKSYRPDIKDGGQLRDFIYIKDAVNMTLFAYDNNLTGLFNVGTGKARSFYDLGAAVFKAMGKAINIEYIDMPEDIRDKYQYFTQANMDRMINEFKYNEKIASLEEGVEDYVKNYLTADDQYVK